MYRNSFLLLIVLLATAFSMHAQQLAVKSFRALPHDMDARQNYPEKDQNGELCAIVKVVTPEKGFTFDIGSLGITKTVQRTGEIWVYIPHGAKRFSIFHEKLGVLRDYFFTEKIEQGVCYELALISGSVVTSFIPPKIPTQWLVINSIPVGADVFIDDLPSGKTPYQGELPEGKHTYRVSLDLFHPQAGMLELKSGEERKVVHLELKPNFGSLVLNTSPEQGAVVKIDGMATGKTTPCTFDRLPAGEHILSLSLDEYATTRSQITVLAEQKQEITIPMEPSFGSVKIYSDSTSEIFINGQPKGSGTWIGRLTPGVYTFMARKANHADAIVQRSVTNNQEVELTLVARPVYGVLKIKTNPFDATMKLDGVDRGKTPLTIEKVLIGEHHVELVHEGYGTVRRSVTVVEAEVTEVEEQLTNFREVVIQSNPTGAKLELNGVAGGSTPKTTTLNYGTHNIRLEAPGFVPLTESFDVIENQKNYNFSMISDEAAQAALKHKKYRTRKLISLAAGASFAAVGTFLYLQSEKHYDDYQSATTDATDLHNKVEREQLLATLSFGASAASIISAVVFHVRQRKAGKEMMILVKPGTGSLVLGLTLNL